MIGSFLLTQPLSVSQYIIIGFFFHNLTADFFLSIFINTGSQAFAQSSNILFQLKHPVTGNIHDRIGHGTHLPLPTRILYN